MADSDKKSAYDWLDGFLERIESRIARKINGDRQTLQRVGHCTFCGRWCRGTLKDGFVHDDGEASCHNIGRTMAIPRQVYLEEMDRMTREHLKGLGNG